MALADYIGKYWAGAEVLYGVIIAMTFTSVLREYPGVPASVLQNVVFAALFCCIAWGIADGLFYLWERNYIIRQENRIIESSRSASGRNAAVSMLGEQLDDSILRNIPQEDRVQLYDRLSEFLAGSVDREKVSPREAATILLGTFLRSTAAGLVIVAPFFLIGDVGQALYVSNLLGIVLLFAVGYGRALEKDLVSRVVSGVGAAMIGIVIAGITIALGGLAPGTAPFSDRRENRLPWTRSPTGSPRPSSHTPSAFPGSSRSPSPARSFSTRTRSSRGPSTAARPSISSPTAASPTASPARP